MVLNGLATVKRCPFSTAKMKWKKNHEGQRVRFIKRATLFEISAVRAGAVRQTYLSLREPQPSDRSLTEDLKFIAVENNAAEFMLALERYSELLHEQARTKHIHS
jgi:hypothetical protein